MKTSTKLTIVFAILVAIGIGIISFDGQAENEVIFTTPEGIGTGKVLGIHHCTLKQGVDPQEFERFVVEEYFSPEIELPGWHGMLVKGERGANVGQYIIVYEINSVFTRNYFVPEPSIQSEEAKAIIEKWGGSWAQLQKRVSEMAEISEYTDYVALVRE